MAKTSRSSAYHEAGHAVACFLFRRKFRSITVGPGGGLVLGYRSRLREDPSHAILPFGRVPQIIDGFVMISMAGEIAQRKASPDSLKSWHSQWDRNSQADWVFNIPGWPEYTAYCKARLEATFNDPITWAGVKALARALLKRKKLSYSEARKTYEDAIDKEVRKRARRKNCS
jgi:hypothetical protein